MILVDPRVGSKELLTPIQSIGVAVSLQPLEYGDVCFEGNTGRGHGMIGIERKTLHDMLTCIDDARYNMQRIGMKQMYDKSFLMLEGSWKPHNPNGLLMEGFRGGEVWTECKYKSQRTMYNKLYRYLLSVALSGVYINFSRDLWHTAFNICETYHYFQKKWSAHTSLLQTQTLNIPSLDIFPPLVRRWAAQIESVGVVKSTEAERLFKTPIRLAQSDEEDWMRLSGVGAPTAKKIIREIWGKHD